MAIKEIELKPSTIEKRLKQVGMLYIGGGIVLIAFSQPVVGLITIGAGGVMVSLIERQKNKGR